MNKIIIASVLFVVFQINAQVQLGVYTGSGLLSVHSEDLEFQDSKISFEFGLSYNYLVTEKFEYLINVGYSNNKPTILGYDSEGNSKEIQLNYGGLDYLILGSYYVFEDIISVQAGGVGSGVFTSNVEEMENFNFKNLSNTFDAPDLTYGYVFGVSGSFDNFKLNLRYAKSLNNPYKDYAYYESGTSNEFEEVKARHSYINLSLAYYFTELLIKRR